EEMPILSGEPTPEKDTVKPSQASEVGGDRVLSQRCIPGSALSPVHQGIGKAIGVKFTNDNVNRFSGARQGRKGQASAGINNAGGEWVPMKILSWNIRGLGGLEKRKE
ncbi:hypothetical protein A2U01_0044759, partial [Trifolium medium]|nr:hypothetical protein [Trifolium medium]